MELVMNVIGEIRAKARLQLGKQHVRRVGKACTTGRNSLRWHYKRLLLMRNEIAIERSNQIHTSRWDPVEDFHPSIAMKAAPPVTISVFLDKSVRDPRDQIICHVEK